MYGLAVFPPIDLFDNQNITRMWFADDRNVADTRLRMLHCYGSLPDCSFSTRNAFPARQKFF